MGSLGGSLGGSLNPSLGGTGELQIGLEGRLRGLLGPPGSECRPLAGTAVDSSKELCGASVWGVDGPPGSVHLRQRACK